MPRLLPILFLALISCASNNPTASQWPHEILKPGANREDIRTFFGKVERSKTLPSPLLVPSASKGKHTDTLFSGLSTAHHYEDYRYVTSTIEQLPFLDPYADQRSRPPSSIGPMVHRYVLRYRVYYDQNYQYISHEITPLAR